MWMSRVAVVVFVGSLVVVPVVASAQATQPSQPTQPLQTPHPTTRPGNQSAEEMLRQMLQPQGEAAQPLKPAEGGTPGQDDSDIVEARADTSAPTGQPLVREGTPLLDRLGRLTPSADGKRMEFTLESDGRTLADPPMVLLPNRKLMQLEDRLRTSYRDLKVTVSGEVTEYRGRNYLLLSRWTVVSDVVQPLR
jgi:hypothetical protein